MTAPVEAVAPATGSCSSAGASTAEVIGFRPVTAADGPAIEAMVERSSPASRYGRFLAPVHSLPVGQLERILHPGLCGGAWVAITATPLPQASSTRFGRGDGVGQLGPDVVALADWAIGPDGSAEVGLLVQDDRQRQGIGSALLAIVTARARAAGARALVASVLDGSTHVQRMVEEAFGPSTVTSDGHVRVIRSAPSVPRL